MKHARRRIGLYLGCTALGLLSLAVWGKMRFVTNLPRMAYADPEREHSLAHDEPAPDNESAREESEESRTENTPPESGGD